MVRLSQGIQHSGIWIDKILFYVGTTEGLYLCYTALKNIV